MVEDPRDSGTSSSSADSTSGSAAAWSHSCGWDDLLVAVGLAQGRRRLVLSEGWKRRWAATWRYAGDKVTCLVDDLAALPRSGLGPVRGFTWRRDQRHRPGLEYLVSTRRQHGFESLEEDRLLLVLDFCGEVTEVLSQPLEMRFQTAEKWRKHTPDFLAVTAAGTWLIDVRPERLIKAADLESFAAAQEVALSCGWHYAVVARWRPPCHDDARCDGCPPPANARSAPAPANTAGLRFPRCAGGADQLVRWGLRGFRFTRSAVAWSV